MDLDEYYSYNLLNEEFFQRFCKDFGELKLMHIQKTIDNSKAVRILIDDCLDYDELPNGTTLATVLLGTRHFMFSKSIVIACASFLALNKVLESFYDRQRPASNEKALAMGKSIIRTYRKI